MTTPTNSLGALRELGLSRRAQVHADYFAAAAATPEIPQGPIAGIDCSNWQATVNWGQVIGAGYQFGICKASESIDYADTYFAANWAGMLAHNVARGAYHFCQPDKNAPQTEAAWFLRCVNAAGGLLPGDVLVGDFEAGTGNLHNWAVAWLDAVAQAVGFLPMFYSGRWFMDPHGLVGSDQLAQHGLWLAEYDSTPPVEPPNWAFVAMWQFSCTGQVPGVQGDCDENVFFGSVDQLRMYGLPSGSSGPAPPTLTNADIVKTERYLLAEPPDVAGAIRYLQQFS